MKFLLDTHTWLWWHTNPDKLSAISRNAIEKIDQYEELLLSAISFWEFSKLIELKRLHLGCDGESWLKEAIIMPKLRIVQLTPEIAWKSTNLPGKFHTDPVDQIIVATAREENAVLITVDGKIREYPHVRCLW